MQQTSDTTVERPASTSGLQFRLHPTSEAERVGVAQVAQLLPSGASAGSGQLSAQLSGTLSALDMLMERVRSVHSVMQRMAAGEVPFDADVARGAAALASGLPALGDLAALRQEVSGEADVLMMVLAAAVTKGSGAGTSGMINRYNLAYDRTGAAGISKRLTVPPTGGATRSPSEPLITP
ncbi:COP9 signalosome complex subunit 6a [Auxenochlorella protothecoides]|uniref:COP9 signalosome complex subunit 6a n=1 Tax=Auxenochlorella protothecoides TaxID=3075 RepID=A0A087SND7_AUXPR|nr:COP9 signalosome complex subunit 6a [Auxenochlorella protothecoides]KFM27241.1 COP9 signalosome complex subunit 6a [Auxenochlorella protothecoides]